MNRLPYLVKTPGFDAGVDYVTLARFITFADAVEYMHSEAQKAIAAGEHFTAFVYDVELDQTLSILTVQSRRSAYDAYIKQACAREVKTS